MAPASQYELAQPPSDSVTAVAYAPQSPTRLLASSWDKHVYLYDTHNGSEDAQGTLLNTFQHRAPVLDVCFGATDNVAYSACLDWQVYRIDLETGEKTSVVKHGAPVRCVVHSPQHSLLISASWDQSLQIHNTREPSTPNITIPLPGKPHALAASPSKLVVAMTARLVHIFDLTSLPSLFGSPNPAEVKPWQQRESSLKFLTRAVSCMPNDAGYATSSIEGRVAVEWFEDSAESQARKYAFKCHRQAAPADENGGGGDIVYPVNSLVFHPVYGTFASAGGDGTVALWDAEAKRRMKQYQKFPDNVAALAFSADGKYLAIGVCPGFETGVEDYSGEGKTKIFIRELGDGEAKGKGAK
ncbi:mitotic checkpoint protein BUB3 [Sodiomyces alkalinus F11]|uniref:Mitotic checkpoint protein BUB3 n=1 Tax=Sodiomyces alkalinus (strain CBS 110278 / VKM F-3762 / F11) TaxID=1314773 RepID=A0A3N2PY18_SODAK|nr:mitotic checkpoint protein BUB3 [Sodiomyces alkalinus F11]ROT39420.1 mitotic checkpoint protein BUB3 [Sodiomyces alkalinus F11]